MKILLFFISTLLLFSCVKQPQTSTTVQVVAPGLKTNNAETDSLSLAFHIAMGDVYSNIRIRKGGINNEELPVLFAGMDYHGAWTRDISISAWNSAAMLYPEVIKNSLNEVLKIDSNGDTIIGGQYWDNIIWTIGAWNYYIFSGDKNFLNTAYGAITKTLSSRERDEYDSTFGLFRGAAVYGDGISAYDDEYTHTGEYKNAEWLSNIDKWVEANPDKKAKQGFGLPMMVLSTNAVYYQAYVLLAKMEDELSKSQADVWRVKADKLKASINKHLWDSARQTYNYYIDPWKIDQHQEALGIAFALLFNIADSAKAQQVIAHSYSAPAGIPCVYPSYQRYRKDSANYGRHSGVVWVHAQGFWADAVARNGGYNQFNHEFFTLSNVAVRDMQFREIYHPETTLPYGGLQEDGFVKDLIREWKSTERQTWSATAYLRLVFNNLLGISASVDGINFQPYLPYEFENFRLLHLPYRGAVLNIYLKGKGSKIKQCRINDKIVEKAFIPAQATGKQIIEITLGDE